jgi:hypothetical protein
MPRGGRKVKETVSRRLWGLLLDNPEQFVGADFSLRDIMGIYIARYGPKHLTFQELAWVVTKKYNKPDNILLAKNERGRWFIAVKEN